MHFSSDTEHSQDATQSQPRGIPDPEATPPVMQNMTNDVCRNVCDLCEAEVEEVMICPNGKEICHECFNAGQC